MPDLKEFELADFSRWEQQVAQDLGVDHINQLTTYPNHQGIDLFPYADHTTSPVDSPGAAYRFCTAKQPAGWQGARYWLNMERIESSDTVILNRLALQALSGGADGVILTIHKEMDWAQLIQGISVGDCQLAIEGSLDSINDFLEFLNHGNQACKGFGEIRKLPHLLLDNPEGLLNLMEISSGFRTLIVQESKSEPGNISAIALLLCQGIFCINTLLGAGASMKSILQNLQIKLPIGDQYLWEICRLRSIRILFHKIVAQYKLTDFEPGSLKLHAITSSGKLATVSGPADDNLQLVRNTTQSISAILGGANIISVLPHQGGFESTDEISRRIARNISHILREESYFNKTADPVAGSYHLELLTDRMCREVWSILQQLERTGGYQEIIKQS